MENNGIWDIIAKLTKGLSADNKTENNKNEEEIRGKNSTAKNSSADHLKGESLGNTTDKAGGKNLNNSEQAQGENSFLKSYNPFLSPSLERPQIISKRGTKPSKNIIDLSSGKNLALQTNENRDDNILKLINRHNYYIKKIQDKNK